MPTVLPRLYDSILRHHLAQWRQMVLLSGPRQVGKTTLVKGLADLYLNWDDKDDRQVILKGASAIRDRLAGVRKGKLGGLPVVVLDELQKLKGWKNYLKGLFDSTEKELRLVVTGSARLDLLKHRGDSLMGRYFYYNMHPLTVGELLDPRPSPKTLFRDPNPAVNSVYDALWRFGGFPDPFTHKDPRHLLKWQQLRHDQLVRDDIRDQTQVQHVGLFETLMLQLEQRSSQALVFGKIGSDIGVTTPTVKNWVHILTGMNHGFLLRPWYNNALNTLKKEPKWFLQDWSGIADEGQRNETFVACHLYKAVHAWSDQGMGNFELFYLRDKAKREVDFLVAKERKPWMLVEAKSSEKSLSPALTYFMKALKAPYGLQVLQKAPFENESAIVAGRAVVAPLRTFLSQLP